MCNQEPHDQFGFILDYKNNEHHYSFFLCEYLKVKDKNQQEIINYLTGLKRSIVTLNERYFY